MKGSRGLVAFVSELGTHPKFMTFLLPSSLRCTPPAGKCKSQNNTQIDENAAEVSVAISSLEFSLLSSFLRLLLSSKGSLRNNILSRNLL